ncbi:MAG: hypothetical protein RL341_96 [Pseudomonadota bacterium]|jgi:hypothetical protein
MVALETSLDHIVIAANHLDEAVYWARQTLGVDAQRGGQHTTMGTHNALIKLSDSTYLELLAIDPSLPEPPHPRWFTLSETATKQRLKRRGPHLIAWAARTDRLEQASAILGGEIHDFKRDRYRWQMSLPSGGKLHEGGAVPLLLEWRSVLHPCQNLPEAGLRLVQLELTVRDPDETELLLKAIHFKMDRAVRLIVSRGTPALRAIIDSPLGRIEI